jgi:hypothetical protein
MSHIKGLIIGIDFDFHNQMYGVGGVMIEAKW